MRHLFFAGFCALFLVLSSCGDETSNTYVTQVFPGQSKDTSVHDPGEYLLGARGIGYFSDWDIPQLFPCYLLNAESIQWMYPDSKYAQDNITDHLALQMVNPGTGTKVTLKMSESELTRASETSFVVEEDQAEEELWFAVSVDWKHEALRNWKKDNYIVLRWDVELDGQRVQQFTQKFYCYGIHAYRVELPCSKDAFTGEELVALKQDLENYPYTENEDYVYISFLDMLSGYVDENSPLIDKLKREVFDDGVFPAIDGAASRDNEELEQALCAYAYLMWKHDIRYATRQNGEMQYVRTIDDIFTDGQGYCMELATAFASWCMNLGLKVQLNSTPNHVTATVHGFDGKELHFDPTLLSAGIDLCKLDRTKPVPEQMELLEEFYQLIREHSDKRAEQYAQDRLENPCLYFDSEVTTARYYIPSFNLSDARWNVVSRAADGRNGEGISIIRPGHAWWKHLHPVVEK